MDLPLTIRRLGLAAIASGAMIASGCGDEGDRQQVLPVGPSQLAYFTTSTEHSGEQRYQIETADDHGDNRRDVGVPGGIVPNLFGAVSWAPDGGRLAFAGGKGEQTGDAMDRSDVYVVSADGSRLTQLTTVADASEPRFSPDGETIVFTRGTLAGREREAGAGLWSIRADGTELTRLTDPGPMQLDRAGSFSPNGTTLAFTRSEFHLTSAGLAVTRTIHTIAEDGSDERVLIEKASDPAFSPDGDRLAFVTDRDDNGELCYGDRCFFANELYVADVDGEVVP